MRSENRKTPGATCRLGAGARELAAALLIGVAVLLTGVDAAAAIIANLESPSMSELSSGIGNVQGWAFTTAPGDEIDPLIDVYIDGQFALQVPCCSDRADVKQSYPQAPVLSGFSGAFNFQALVAGQHTIEAHVYSNYGGHVVLTTTFASEAIAVSPFYKEFDWDDAKADHCTPNNTMVAGEQVARLVCTGFTLKNGSGGFEYCAGSVELTWMSSSQGFRVTQGCSLIALP